jgi:hypothetical protein
MYLKRTTPRREERRIPPPRLIAVTYTGDIHANAWYLLIYFLPLHI